jgi:hypothetical protein
MTKNARGTLAITIVLGIAILVFAGLRMAPPQQAANSAESRQECHVEAPDTLQAAAKQWCANGLFSRVVVTEDDKNVIAVLHFSPNGTHVWQLQSNGLLASFRPLTERLAADGGGRNVAVSVHDASDKRIGACARLTTDAAATCEAK